MNFTTYVVAGGLGSEKICRFASRVVLASILQGTRFRESEAADLGNEHLACAIARAISLEFKTCFVLSRKQYLSIIDLIIYDSRFECTARFECLFYFRSCNILSYR